MSVIRQYKGMFVLIEKYVCAEGTTWSACSKVCADKIDQPIHCLTSRTEHHSSALDAENQAFELAKTAIRAHLDTLEHLGPGNWKRRRF